ncbi:MAG: iron-containing alcohol dehydrogenase [Candidatus Hydrogenedentes bacterium]|nr:iron-containing alcohol dehydrogenase [Candidatus Hydrogenedentota bacterium]
MNTLIDSRMNTLIEGLSEFNFYLPTNIIFKVDALKDIRSFALGEKPFIVTGKNSSKKNGALEFVQKCFPNGVIFDRVEENPSAETCDTAGNLCKEEKCDWVICIGGGSPLDTGKCVAGLATNGGKCADYFGRDLFKNSPLPILAVPTTAGTGSEVTQYAVITDRKNNTKKTVADRRIFPKVALADPNLTLTMNRDITLSTGLDALSQCMEGIVSKKSTPITDTLALEGCRILKEYIPNVLKNPSDLHSRTMVMYASLLSGIVIAHTGTTLVHALGYYYTLYYGIPHGIANALFLIPMFRRNEKYLPEKVKTLSNAISNNPNFGTITKIEDNLKELFSELDFSYKAKDWGVESKKFPEFAENLANDPYRFRNQYGTFDMTELENIFEESYLGK